MLTKAPQAMQRSARSTFLHFSLTSPDYIILDHIFCCTCHQATSFSNIPAAPTPKCPSCGHILDSQNDHDCDSKFEIRIPFMGGSREALHVHITRERAEQKGWCLVFPFAAEDPHIVWTWDAEELPRELGTSKEGSEESEGSVGSGGFEPVDHEDGAEEWEDMEADSEDGFM